MAEFPRVILAHAPTPLEPLPRLGRELGLANLYVKRDDCTGLAMGGNKARQLEYYFGEAVAAGADVVLITGAVQSNFMRMTAAAAAKLGMACHVQLEDRVKDMDPDYHASGNVLLDRLFGATIHNYPEGDDEAGADAALEALAADLRAEGHTPYIVYLSPGHPPIGALGYRDAALEMMDQAAEMGLTIDKVIVPSGSALTHAGTLVGLRERSAEVECVGICVRRTAEMQRLPWTSRVIPESCSGRSTTALAAVPRTIWPQSTPRRVTLPTSARHRMGSMRLLSVLLTST